MTLRSTHFRLWHLPAVTAPAGDVRLSVLKLTRSGRDPSSQFDPQRTSHPLKWLQSDKLLRYGIERSVRMKRVAVFGNAGGGKSTLARALAELTGLPLYVVDMMQFRPGGMKVPQQEFLQAHADLLLRDEWI